MPSRMKGVRFARNFSILCLILVVSLGTGRITPPAKAHNGTVLGVWSSTPPTIDGTLSPGEWNTTSSASFSLGLPYNGTVYAMNDGANLYVAVMVTDPTPGDDAIAAYFDNNHNGIYGDATPGEDLIFVGQPGANGAGYFIDACGTAPPPAPLACSDSTTDGAGSSRSTAIGNVFEFSHPLCSGDPADFCLYPRSTVGFAVRYFDAAQGITVLDSTWPSTNPGAWADIRIVPNPGPGTWSPFGPREENLTLKVYSSPQNMISDFNNGGIDLPGTQASNPSVDCANPDFYCTPSLPQGQRYMGLEGWDYQSVPPGTGSSLVSVSNQGFSTGWGFWPLLNMRQRTLCSDTPAPGCYTPTDVKYTPGCLNPPSCTSRDRELIRRGIPAPLLHTGNPYTSNIPGDLEFLSLAYDSLLKVNPLTEAAITSTYTVSSPAVSVAAGSRGAASASCDPGDFAAGGGFNEGGNVPSLVLADSFPIPSGAPTGWAVGVFNPGAVDGIVEAKVVCMRPVSLGPSATSTYTVSSSVTVTPGTSGMVDALCSTAGDFVTGGGEATTFLADGALAVSVSDALVNTQGLVVGWEARAYNPTSVNLGLVAFGVCMTPTVGPATYGVAGPFVSIGPASGGSGVSQANCRDGDIATGGGFYSTAAPDGTSLTVAASTFQVSGSGTTSWFSVAFSPTGTTQTFHAIIICITPFTGLRSDAQVIDWMAKDYSQTVNAQGNTVLTFHLRPDLMFHDGTSVTAADVVFSISTYYTVPSYHYKPYVSKVLADVACGSGCIQVTLQGTSLFHLTNIGLLPIVPKHVWSGPCNTLPPQCTDPSFDPMINGMVIGSGPWVCLNLNTRVAGGPCGRTGGPGSNLLGQVVAPSGSTPYFVILKRYDTTITSRGFHRCCPNVQASSLQKVSWADINDDGIVNILDIASAALVFGQFDKYWTHPLFGCSPLSDICGIALLASYYGTGLTCPFCGTVAPPPLTGLDPQIDPFRVDLGVAGVVYYKGATAAVAFMGGSFALDFAVLSGAPSPSLLTAQLSTDPAHSWGTGFTGLPQNPGVIRIVFGPAGTFCPPPTDHYDERTRYPNPTSPTSSSDFEHMELFGPIC